jgi:hypothetical protein
MGAPPPAATLASSPPGQRQPETTSEPAARAVAGSQASLNEIVAEIIRTAPGDRQLITMALNALREHNLGSWLHIQECAIAE